MGNLSPISSMLLLVILVFFASLVRNYGFSTFNNRPITNDFPLCIFNASDLVYSDVQGSSVDTYETFLKCLSRISGPKLIPSLNQTEPVKIYTSVEFNNIGDIDPAGAYVELDFYIRFWWNDPRLNMPAYWENQDNIGVKEVHLDRIFYDSAGIFIWRPDIFYHDGCDISCILLQLLTSNSKLLSLPFILLLFM